MTAQPGPFLVTVKRPCPGCAHVGKHPGATATANTSSESRVAVASLKSAQLRAYAEVCQHTESAEEGRPFEVAVWALPATGGTIGPLPDGTEIKVEATTYIDLWKASGEPSFDDKAKILAAFNERFGNAALDDDSEPGRCASCGGHLGQEGGGGGADPCDCSEANAAQDGAR